MTNLERVTGNLGAGIVIALLFLILVVLLYCLAFVAKLTLGMVF